MAKQDVKRQRYEAWVRAHADELYRFAHRLAGQASVAEDLVQETFYEAWRSMDNLREEKKARAWLFQILRHRYSHWVRDSRRRVEASVTLGAEGVQVAAEAREPGEAMAEREGVARALASLEDRFRIPLLMVFLEGMSCREAAKSLGVPLGTVLSRIHRARQQLREHLGREESSREADRRQDNEEDGRFRLRFGGDA